MRRIIVNGDGYRRTCERGPETPGAYFLHLQIWRVRVPRPSGRLRVRLARDRARVIDPWLDCSPGSGRDGPPRYRAVTPGLLRGVLDAARARGGDPRGLDESTLYAWADEERLAAIPTAGSHPSRDSSDRTRASGWQA